MTEPNEPDLNSHPHIGEEPLRSGNPPETQADREDVVFRPPAWVVDRKSAGVLMLVIVVILLAIGALAIGFLLDVRLW